MDKEYIKTLLREAIHALGEETIPLKSHTAIRDDIVETARKYIGGKYLYGGKDMSKIFTVGVDCSGFVRGVLKECGINIVDGSCNQWEKAGKKTTNPRPGDLVFYANSNGVVNHVALFIGDNKIINCGSTPIKETNADYRKILGYKNVIGD